MIKLKKITSLLAGSGILFIAATAYAAPADLDLTFSGDGIVTNSLNGSAFAVDVTTQSDGKIIAVGGSNEDFAVSRYNTNGSLDSTFDGDGQVTTNFGGQDQAGGVALQSDGKIVVVGFSGGNFALARYNTNGSLDSTFGSGGKVNSGLGGIEQARAVAIQSDGKIIAAGVKDQDAIVARYNTNGSLDRTFAGDGTNRLIRGNNEYFSAVAIQPSGKIVASGSSIGDGSTNFSGDFVLAQFNTNGQLDATFGVNGEVKQGFGGDDRANDMVLTPSGQILVSGQLNSRFGVARFNSNGVVDTSFGSNGQVTTIVDNGSLCNGIAIDSNGRIVLAGYALGQVSDYNFAVVRVTSNGSLDTTFNNGSPSVVTTFGQGNSSNDRAYAVTIQNDGKIVVAGQNNNNFALARYSGNGIVTATINNTNPSGGNS